VETYPTLLEALKRETQIKKLSHEEKIEQKEGAPVNHKILNHGALCGFFKNPVGLVEVENEWCVLTN
jgi:hypothetical protein